MSAGCAAAAASPAAVSSVLRPLVDPSRASSAGGGAIIAQRSLSADRFAQATRGIAPRCSSASSARSRTVRRNARGDARPSARHFCATPSSGRRACCSDIERPAWPANQSRYGLVTVAPTQSASAIAPRLCTDSPPITRARYFPLSRGAERDTCDRNDRARWPKKTDPPGRGNPGGSQIGAGDRGGVSADRGCQIRGLFASFAISRGRPKKVQTAYRHLRPKSKKVSIVASRPRRWQCI